MPDSSEKTESVQYAHSRRARGHWSRKLDFWLVCVGYAVGLGNVWRFPYLCMKNGGGAFLVPYFLMLFLCVIPLFFLELALGQFASLGPPQSWKISPIFKGLGWAPIVMGGITTLSYSIILAWTWYYLAHSFTKTLPWATCGNEWNTPTCTLTKIDISSARYMNTSINNTWNRVEKLFNSSTYMETTVYNIENNTDKTRTAAEEFWQYKMLQMSSGIEDIGSLSWELVICLMATYVVVYFCLFRGIKSSGKAVYVTATLPYIILTVLLIRGCTLPGSLDGIKYYLIPEFNSLLSLDVWLEASIQIFYSLGIGFGGLITIASYNKFNNNCFWDTIIIPCINCGTSFYAGFVVFSVAGNLAKEAGVHVKDIISSGPGLAFIAYPEALARLPGAPYWSVLFFFMLITLGLDSMFMSLEKITTGFADMFPQYLGNKRMLVTGIMCLLLFTASLPLTSKGGIYIMQVVDWYSASLTPFIVGILECVVIAYVYGVNRFYYDIEMMIGKQIGILWKVCWCGITPACLMVVLVMVCTKLRVPTYGAYVYPGWAVGIGWCMGLISMIPIPLVMVIEITKSRGSLLERIRTTLKPSSDWGPALLENRINYKYAKEYKRKQSSLDGVHEEIPMMADTRI